MPIYHHIDPHVPRGVTAGEFKIQRMAARSFVTAIKDKDGPVIFIAEVMMANSKDEQAANACLLAGSKAVTEALSRVLVNTKNINPRDRMLAETALAKAQGRMP